MPKTTNTGKGKKRKNLKASIVGGYHTTFANLLRSSSVKPKSFSFAEEGPFELLELPRAVRVRIWRILGFSHTKTLRLVCSLIKEDIDKFTGISSAIDSTFDDFPFHCNIAIRKVAVHELIIPNYIEFLKYPHILQELEIRGEISAQNFQYIIRSCPNISKLFITFNKFVLDQKTPLFPLPVELVDLQPLSKLRSLKLVSTTKKISEMMYVHGTIVNLLRDTLSRTNIFSLHICVAHKASSVYFREIVWTSLLFVHKHAATLRYLSLTFRDKDASAISADTSKKSTDSQDTNTNVAGSASPKNSGSAKAVGSGSEPQTGSLLGWWMTGPSFAVNVEKQQASNVSAGRRDTDALPLPPGVVITHHVKDIHADDNQGTSVTTSPEGEGEADVDSLKSEESTEETSVTISDATRFISDNPWPKAINLEQLWLTLSLKYMEELLHIISPQTKLLIIQLEAVGGGASQSNWSLYKQFVQRGDPRSLKVVALFSVANVSSGGSSLPIELGVFRKSKDLRKLSIFCQKRDDFTKLSRAKGISNLPAGLSEIVLERVLLTPWQVIRLLMCYGLMIGVSLSYWSINDCQFSVLMTMLKWCLKLQLIDVCKISLVDTKLRFKNKRKAVRSLQEAVAISVRYQDFEDTRLVIDVSKQRDDKLFAPRVSIRKTSPTKIGKTKGKKQKDNT